MADEPRRPELREVKMTKDASSTPPEIARGDEIEVEDHRAIVYAILFEKDDEPGPNGYEIGVAYLEGNRGMANFAGWSESEQCWKFRKGEIPRDARPGLDELIQKLRFRVVK